MTAKRLEKLKTKTQPLSSGAAVFAAGVNEGFDRQMTVTGRTTEGTPIQVSSFQIIQLGLREPFVPNGTEETLLDANGEEFGVLKEN